VRPPRPDTRSLLLATLAVAVVAALATSGSEPVGELLRTGLRGRATPDELTAISAGQYGKTAEGLVARALYGAADGEDPRPWLDRAVRAEPDEADWRRIRLLYASGVPAMLMPGESGRDPDGMWSDLRILEREDPADALPRFLRAILLYETDRPDEGADAIDAASRLQRWNSGLDRLHGVATHAAASAFGRDLRMILGALDCDPMMSIRPAVRAVGAYLALAPDSGRLEPDERLARTVRIGRLALLIRGTPERTTAEQVLSDQMLGHVRSSLELLPEGSDGPDIRLMETAVRTASPRAGYLHVLREQRNRLARWSGATVSRVFVAALVWLGGLMLLVVGGLALVAGAVPVGHRTLPVGSPAAMHVTRFVWVGGTAVGLLLLFQLGTMPSSTLAATWTAGLRVLTERVVAVGIGGLLAALVISYLGHRRGLLHQPLAVTLQLLTVATAVAVIGTAAAAVPDIRTLGAALEGWYEPPAEVSLSTELNRPPLPG
jgi:hypothetical protein